MFDTSPEEEPELQTFMPSPKNVIYNRNGSLTSWKMNMNRKEGKILWKNLQKHLIH